MSSRPMRSNSSCSASGRSRRSRGMEINESSLGYVVKAYRAQHLDPKTVPLPVEAENRRLGEKTTFAIELMARLLGAAGARRAGPPRDRRVGGAGPQDHAGAGNLRNPAPLQEADHDPRRRRRPSRSAEVGLHRRPARDPLCRRHHVPVHRGRAADLATVINLFDREVVGWSIADHMRTELISDALTMAHTHRRIEPGALFHSDRGSQYTSHEYAELANSLGVCLFLGRTGVWGQLGGRIVVLDAQKQDVLSAVLRHPTEGKVRGDAVH